jgi:hypothetical protein
VIDHVETRLDVGIQHPVVALGAESVDVGHGIVRPPLGSEPIRDRQKVAADLQHSLPEVGLHQRRKVPRLTAGDVRHSRP